MPYFQLQLQGLFKVHYCLIDAKTLSLNGHFAL